jgi:hypothetical protein
LGKTGQPICQASDFVQGAPDEADAFRRAERLLEAAAQSGLDLGDLDATPPAGSGSRATPT